MKNDDDDRVQQFSAKYRSLLRHCAHAEQTKSAQAIAGMRKLETEMIEVLLDGVGRRFAHACELVPLSALYKIGASGDIERTHYHDRHGICLTGENAWPRERWGRQAPIGDHADFDYWAIVFGGTKPRLHRATYTSVTDGEERARWSMHLEEVTPLRALEDGLTVDQVTDRLGEALATFVARAAQSEAATIERIKKYSAILSLLTTRNVTALARLAVLGFFAAYSVACGSGSGSQSEPDAAPPVCTGSVLHPATNECVQCTAEQRQWCPTGHEICRPDNTCDICRSNSDCPSDVCLPDGSCALQEHVAYVRKYPVGGDCTREIPCSAATAVTKGKLIYRVYEYAGFTAPFTVADTQRVMVIGDPGITSIYLHADLRGPSARLTLAGLIVEPATLDTAFCVRVSLGASVDITGSTLLRCGLAAGEGSIVSVRHSHIVHAPTYGVLAADASHVLIDSTYIVDGRWSAIYVGNNLDLRVSNNVILDNGGTGSTTPAVVVYAPSIGSITHNTIADNRQTIQSASEFPPKAAGLRCEHESTNLEVSGNLIVRNDSPSAGDEVPQYTSQVSSECRSTFSLISRYALQEEEPSNTYVYDGVLRRVVRNADVSDYRLISGSLAIDAADPSSAIETDIDGNARTGRRDIGAYEYTEGK